MNLLFRIAFMVTLAAPSFAAAQSPNPSAWVTDGEVWAILPTPSAIYIGGHFSNVGPYTGYGVPLSKSSGDPVATYPQINGLVWASISDGSGGWFVGGDFTKAGSLSRNHIAHIKSDGTVDSAWNPNCDGSVRAFFLSGSKLYAGGQFHYVGGVERRFVVQLDSSTGKPTSWNARCTNDVFAVAASGSAVYIGGNFQTVGSVTRNYIAAVDATTGAVLHNWNPGANNMVQALAVSGSTLYVGGNFTTIGGQARNRVAALDSAGKPTGWDPNASGGVYALGISGSTVYAGGMFAAIGGQTRSRIAALDIGTGKATAWNPAVHGHSVYSTALSDSKVYIGGEFTGVGGQQRKNIAAIDSAGKPTSWKPNALDVVRTVAASDSAIYVGGQFASFTGVSRPSLAAIDPATGKPTSFNPKIAYSAQGISSLAIDGTTLYAGVTGPYWIGTDDPTVMKAIDINTGVVVTNPKWKVQPDYKVLAMIIRGSTLHVGGNFKNINGTFHPFIAQFENKTYNATADWALYR